MLFIILSSQVRAELRVEFELQSSQTLPCSNLIRGIRIRVRAWARARIFKCPVLSQDESSQTPNVYKPARSISNPRFEYP